MASQCTFVYARHAAERAAASIRIDLRRGAASLRAIAWTAPLLGMLGTTVMLKNLFRAYSLPGYDHCDCAGGMAETYVPLLLSSPVSVFAQVGLHGLRRQLEALDFDMRTGIVGILNYLACIRSAGG